MQKQNIICSFRGMKKAEQGVIRDRKELVEKLLKEEIINFDEALMLMEKQKEYIPNYPYYPISTYTFSTGDGLRPDPIEGWKITCSTN